MVTCHILNYVDKLSYSVKNENDKGGGGARNLDKIPYFIIMLQIRLFFYFNDQHITGSIKLCDGNLKKYY